MARILHNAKEELVYWATDMNLHETAADKFINQILYTNALFAASDFIAHVSSPKTKTTVLNSLLQQNAELPALSRISKLRQSA